MELENLSCTWGFPAARSPRPSGRIECACGKERGASTRCTMTLPNVNKVNLKIEKPYHAATKCRVKQTQNQTILHTYYVLNVCL